MPKSSCQPSTLTWRVRKMDSNKPQESFQLQVRNTYIGRTSFGSPKVRKTIRSGDNKFSVNHGASAAGDILTLTWNGDQYKFNSISTSRVTSWSTSTKEPSSKEYEYWACLTV
ncbi:hypothetical protein BG015_002099 [Linnemannia schmuckeri]|uniref:Uncharacterized protein n=1 Tax=Linnemannia schmuckeri TaxID=64567 RepID=A0A9P5VDR9_9FUNG|nr:hypothetical protein BG015_002099 [Linnemannia schmuckeri]